MTTYKGLYKTEEVIEQSSTRTSPCSFVGYKASGRGPTEGAGTRH